MLPPPPGSPPVLVSTSEYAGQPEILVNCTQLDHERYTRTQATRIVSEWVDFFAAGPSEIRRLRFVSRTPKRLFHSLSAQVQLESLRVKWGDYEDLSILQNMADLHQLHLCGATAVRTVTPLASLHNVSDLALNGLKRVTDLSPLGRMKGLRKLALGGGGFSDWTAKIDSLAFLRELPHLEYLWMDTLAAQDRDYTPLLDLQHLTTLGVMEVRGMRPSYADLARSIPALTR